MNERALDNKCPACHAPIKFIPSLNKWKCEYCCGEFTLEEMQRFNNASSEKNNDNVKSDSNDSIYVNYHCKDCGAEIIADETTTATFCVYCGNTAILKSKLSGKFAPSKIIPFKKEKNEVVDAFKNLHKGKPLMPKFFNDPKNIEKITGVYIPFWLNNYTVDGSLDVRGTNVTSWTVGDTHYTKTDIYSVLRDGAMDFNKIPVDGSSKFNDDIMNSIEPFDFSELKNYNHAYLSGFLAEKYDVEGEEIDKIASSRALSSARMVMLNDIVGVGTKTITSDKLNAINTLKEYALLPVWMVNIKYGGKMHTFAMNGQTGELVGDIPVDKKKAVLYWILIFVITFGLVILISYLIYIKGGN